jgi:SAM-dependent methyltransferase
MHYRESARKIQPKKERLSMSHKPPSSSPNLQRVMLSEADAWWKRNRQSHNSYEPSASFARLLTEIKRLKFRPGSFLEVGGSDGYTLLAFERFAPGSSPVVGVEASAMAVEHGAKELSRRQSSVKLVKGSGHSLPFLDESFDLVYLGFVLYLADENMLHKFYGEAIRVLRPGGLLCLTDFYPTGATPEYTHDPEIKIHKRDHVASLLSYGKEKLGSVFLEVSSSPRKEKNIGPRNLLSNLDDLEINVILIKKV